MKYSNNNHPAPSQAKNQPHRLIETETSGTHKMRRNGSGVKKYSNKKTPRAVSTEKASLPGLWRARAEHLAAKRER